MSKRFETTPEEIEEIKIKAQKYNEHIQTLIGREVTHDRFGLKGKILAVSFSDDYSELKFRIHWATGIITYENESVVVMS